MINNKLIIAHRGGNKYEKENTMGAFKSAVKLKADMIEFDVRKTKDNKMIIYHDDKIGNKKVIDMTHEEINNNLGYETPVFEDVLKYFRGITKLDVHLKETGYEDVAIKLILMYYDLKEFIICSEIPSSLEKIKKIFPEVKTGLVMTGYFSDILFFIFRGFSKKEMYENYVDILIPRWQLTNFIFLNKAKKYNKKVIAYSIDNKKIAEKFLNYESVIGIVTNIPDLMKD